MLEDKRTIKEILTQVYEAECLCPHTEYTRTVEWKEMVVEDAKRELLKLWEDHNKRLEEK